MSEISDFILDIATKNTKMETFNKERMISIPTEAWKIYTVDIHFDDKDISIMIIELYYLFSPSIFYFCFLSRRFHLVDEPEPVSVSAVRSGTYTLKPID